MNKNKLSPKEAVIAERRFMLVTLALGAISVMHVLMQF